MRCNSEVTLDIVVCTGNGRCIILCHISSYNTDASAGSVTEDLVSGLEVYMHLDKKYAKK